MKNIICTPIVASTVKEALQEIAKAKYADLIELRIDLIKNINETNLSKLIKKVKKSKKKSIVTDRRKRLSLINTAIKLKSDFIDVDISLGEKEIKRIKKIKKNTKLIVSFHNFKKTDKKDIEKNYKKIKLLKPEIIKIATLAKTIDDNRIIFD